MPRHINGNSPTYKIRENFDQLRDIISSSLKSSNFIEQANEVASCKDEAKLNDIIVRQYTEETDLYKVVNSKLRDCHLYQDYDTVINDEDDKFLAPWILQLSSCIKILPHYKEKVYRGANLSEEDISLYNIGDMFIWAPFVSASKYRENCFGGTVLFEINTSTHFFGMNDKAYPRDIANKSIFPDEEEVLFPIACAYRVERIEKFSDHTLIELQTLDQY